jgi:transcription antitermination factor NusG
LSDAWWGCAQTGPSQEQRALVNLRRQGFEAFYPFYLAKTKKRKQTVIKPVFSSYVFVRLGEDFPWSSINSTYGVSRLLTCQRRGSDIRVPQRIPDDFMNSLTRYLRSSNSVGPEFTANTRVRILGGALASQEAIVLRWSNADRVSLLFKILNREVQIEMAVEEIEEIESRPDDRGIKSVEGAHGNLRAAQRIRSVDPRDEISRSG